MNQEVLGWLGLALIGFAAIPQTLQVLRQGHAEGMSWVYISCAWFGFAFLFVYAITTRVGPALVLNYALQWILFSIMGFVKRYPRPVSPLSTPPAPQR